MELKIGMLIIIQYKMVLVKLLIKGNMIFFFVCIYDYTCVCVTKIIIIIMIIIIIIIIMIIILGSILVVYWHYLLVDVINS